MIFWIFSKENDYGVRSNDVKVAELNTIVVNGWVLNATIQSSSCYHNFIWRAINRKKSANYEENLGFLTVSFLSQTDLICVQYLFFCKRETMSEKLESSVTNLIVLFLWIVAGKLQEVAFFTFFILHTWEVSSQLSQACCQAFDNQKTALKKRYSFSQRDLFD